MFEILKSDLAGRIGILHTRHGKVETPAYVPVVHPVRQGIPPEKIRAMGFDMVITNAYITRKSYGADESREIRDIIGFDGPVMTDSGGYQVLEYGDLDVTPEEIAAFEAAIDTDIAVPLDRPTGFGLPAAEARRSVRHTLAVSKKTLEERGGDGRIWVGPIQGGEHFDLVRQSARSLVKYGFGMLALGSPVEFMESYRYGPLAQMIREAKSQIPAGIPLHLFGAGHPLTIPFAVALGCDTFDSASYILYAKQDRYITESGTRHLAGMRYFSCSCEVCSRHTPAELAAMEPGERTGSIALHNLYSIKAEVDRTKEAIHEGRLWEYTMGKMRAHPRLFEVIGTFLECGGGFMETTPRFKERAVFLFSREDQFRPEVLNYHKMVRKFASTKKILCIAAETQTKPAYLSPQYHTLRKKFRDADTVQFCQYSPFLGIIPLEISDVFPAAHYVASDIDFEPAQYTEFARTWEAFLAGNDFKEVYYDKDDPFLRYYARMIPKGIRKRSL